MAIAQRTAPLAHALRHPLEGAPPMSELREAFDRHEVLTRASALAFQALSVIVPFGLFLAGLAGILSSPDVWTKNLAPDVRPHLSPAAFQVVDKAVRNVLVHQRLFWVTAGLILTLWELSGGARGVMDALDEIYDSPRRRRFGERLWRSLWLGAAAGAAVVGAIAVLRFGPLLTNHVAAVLDVLAAVVRYAIAAALLMAAVGLLVRFGPTNHQPVPWVTFGSGLIVAAWLITWSAYAFYLTNIASYGSIFGAFAVVIVLTTFLYLSAIVFLAGTLVDSLMRERANGNSAPA
jgi:membrane protein